MRTATLVLGMVTFLAWIALHELQPLAIHVDRDHDTHASAFDAWAQENPVADVAHLAPVDGHTLLIAYRSIHPIWAVVAGLLLWTIAMIARRGRAASKARAEADEPLRDRGALR